MELDFLEKLLEKDEEPGSDQFIQNLYKVPEQKGPVRFFDKELRCASRGCSSPTHFKLQGVPYCMIHIIWRMNDVLIDLGVEK